MILGKQELRQLRWPIIVAAILIIAGAATIVVTDQYFDAARQEKAAAQKQRVAAQERITKVAEEERAIRSDLVIYQRMVDRGIVGSRNRLDLIESISTIKDTRKMFEIKYSIDAQKPLDYPGITQTGAMDFVASRMQLNMLLLHEEDLLRFLADLRSAGQSHVSVRQCAVNRLDRAPTAGGVAPLLQAICTVDLITLVEITPS